jgi:hypothetical protein
MTIYESNDLLRPIKWARTKASLLASKRTIGEVLMLTLPSDSILNNSCDGFRNKKIMHKHAMLDLANKKGKRYLQ